MPQLIKKVRGAMFDIKPVDLSGRVSLPQISGLATKINLRKQAAIKEKLKPAATPKKQQILREIQKTINSDVDLGVTLARVGGTMKHGSFVQQIHSVKAQEEDSEKRMREILFEISRPAPEPQTEEIYATEVQAPTEAEENFQYADQSEFSSNSKKLKIFIIGGIIGAVTLLGIGIKERVLQEGNTAIDNLTVAKENLKKFDFNSASKNFFLAYQEFSSAAESLNVLGAGISSIIADLPGAGRFKSAQNIIGAGKLLAKTGQSMSDVAGVVSKTGVVLNPKSNNQILMSQIIGPLKSALAVSDKNLKQAIELFADVNSSIIPDDKREMFREFIAKLPDFQKLVGQGSDYVNFFEEFMGPKKSKKYLLLFENSSELRPTGGFPGTYGILSIEDGRVKDFSTGDIYDLDGQLKEMIIPPAPLQHITPNWAMRDVNWFIDFPTSARKIMTFFKKESGYDVDGVITINPKIMSDILNIIGPIKMPEYDVTLTATNFLATIQNEVEYGDNKKINKPKKIVVDLAPIVLQRLYSADKSKWLEVFNAFASGLEKKDILMYFKNLTLENFALSKDFGGQIHPIDTDYLMVTMSNVKGSKADAVTDSYLNVQTYFQEGALHHKLIIKRKHNGGRQKYPFYNQVNPSYIRVLVPLGADLVKISGNAQPGFKSLVDYAKADFRVDDDLAKLASTEVTSNEVTIYQESGKTAFGFWMITKPGETRIVELDYVVPSELVGQNYQFYVQKQPGLNIKNFEFNLALPKGMTIADADPVLRWVGNRYYLADTLDKDLSIKLTVK